MENSGAQNRLPRRQKYAKIGSVAVCPRHHAQGAPAALALKRAGRQPSAHKPPRPLPAAGRGQTDQGDRYMSQAFTPIARSRASYYCKGSPVHFSMVELFRMEETGETVVTLTFKNL